MIHLKNWKFFSFFLLDFIIYDAIQFFIITFSNEPSSLFK